MSPTGPGVCPRARLAPASLGAVRRFTLITIIALFVLISTAAVYQLVLATRDQERLPGPELGTPLPTFAPAG